MGVIDDTNLGHLWGRVCAYVDAHSGGGSGVVETSSSSATSVATSTSKSLCSATITDPGVYMLLGHVVYASNSSGRRAANFTATANAAIENETVGGSVCVAPASGSATALSLTDIIEVPYGGSPVTRHLTIWQSSGSSLTCRGSVRAVRVSPPTAT